MSKVIFQNITANGTAGTAFQGDGAPVLLRFVGTFSTAKVVAHITTPVGVSNIQLDVDDTNQAVNMVLDNRESAMLEIISADASTNLSCVMING